MTSMASRATISSASTIFNHITNKSHHLSLTFKSNRVVQFSTTCRAIYTPQQVDVIQAKEQGQIQTLDYRVFFLNDSGNKISPWHDIPLHLGDGVFNFVVEIPKDSRAKMEVATDEMYTPIKQDTKKGKLRYYP